MDKKKLPSYIFNFKKIGGFTLFICVICYVITIFYDYSKDEKYNYAKRYLEGNKEVTKNMDIIFLSNSYVFSGFDPLYIENKTGIKSIHLGHHGMGFMYHLIDAIDIIDQYAPKYIVLDVSPSSLNKGLITDDQKLKHYAQKSLIHNPLSFHKLWIMWKLNAFSDLNFTMKSISVITNILANINQSEVTNPFKPKNINTTNYLGFNPLNNSKQDNNPDFDKLFYQQSNNTAPFFNEKTIDKIYFEYLLDYALEKDVQIIFVNTLKTKPVRGLDQLSEILKEGGYLHCKLIDFNNMEVRKKMKIKKRDFYDPSHLNYSGALKQTNYFIESLIANILGTERLDNYKLKLKQEGALFNFVADNNGGFHGQLISEIGHYKNIELNLKYYLKNGETDSLKIPSNSWINMNGELLNNFKLNSTYEKNQIDSLSIIPRGNITQIANLSTTNNPDSIFTLNKLPNGEFKFELQVPNPQNYKFEYVIYRYYKGKLEQPRNLYRDENYLTFDIKNKNIRDYTFKCYYRIPYTECVNLEKIIYRTN